MPRKPIAALALSFAALPVSATEVSFEVTGIDSAEGNILVALYTEATFLKKPLKAARLPAAKGKVVGSLGDVPEGIYALTVVHDVNGNGKLDSNFLRIPNEPYGFSNNPSIYGAPSFEKARIEIKGAAQVIEVRVR